MESCYYNDCKNPPIHYIKFLLYPIVKIPSPKKTAIAAVFLLYKNFPHWFSCDSACRRDSPGMDSGTVRANCVDLSGIEFRLQVCVHSPDEHFRSGARLWQTLSWFLHLGRVNASCNRVYQAREIQTRYAWTCISRAHFKCDRFSWKTCHAASAHLPKANFAWADVQFVYGGINSHTVWNKSSVCHRRAPLRKCPAVEWT